jgi:hypothetical protein
VSGREDVFDRNRRKANSSPLARWLAEREREEREEVAS